MIQSILGLGWRAMPFSKRRWWSYAGLFSPCVIFAVSHMQPTLFHHEFTRPNFFMFKNNEKKNLTSLKFLHWRCIEGKGENKNAEICSQRQNKNICYSFINCLDIILCIKPPFLIFLLSGPEKIYIESWKKMLNTEGHSWPLWRILCHNSGWVCWCQLTFTLSFNIEICIAG